MNDKKFGGEVIRDLRLKNELTLKNLSELVDTGYVYLSRLERNMEKPSEDLIKKLADVLGYKNDINILIASFGRIPSEIEKIILDEPSYEIPQFYKRRGKK